MAIEPVKATTLPLLEISGLNVTYRSGRTTFQAVRNLDLVVARGEFVAIVGQSGSGKSTTAHSIIDLLPQGTSRNATALRFDGHDLIGRSEREMQKIRGKAIGFVPQDPTISLDPVKTIGSQIVEALAVHGVATGTAAAERALSLLDEVGIDRPQQRFPQYPHEISGGMRQRVLIAIALSCEPGLIIADEPTSGLDVTVQRKVLDRIEKLTRERQTAVLFITHDLGIAADRADRIAVMNEGRIVEQGPAQDITRRPRDNYPAHCWRISRHVRGSALLLRTHCRPKRWRRCWRRKPCTSNSPVGGSEDRAASRRSKTSASFWRRAAHWRLLENPDPERPRRHGCSQV